MNKTTIYGALLLLSATAAASGQVFSHTLNTNMSPLDPANGYSYFNVNSSLTGPQVWSASGGVVTSNTMGNGFQGQGSSYAYLPVLPADFTPGQDWVLTARVRVLQSETVSFLFGFSLGAWFDGIGVGLGIVSNGWQSNTLGTGQRDNTQWTTWRIETQRANNTYSVFVDDQLLLTDSFTIANGSPGFGLPANHIFMGDGTGGSNAQAEISSYSFSQVPTPGAVAMVALGVPVAMRRRRAAVAK